MSLDIFRLNNLDFNIVTNGKVNTEKSNYTNVQVSSGTTGDIYTFLTGQSNENLTLSETDVEDNVKEAEQDQNKMAEKQNNIKSQISQVIENIEKTIEDEISHYESQLQSKVATATQEYKNSVKNQDKNERKSFSEFLTQYLKGAASTPSFSTIEGLISQKETLTQEMNKKSDTLSQISTAIESLKIQFNMKSKADKKENPFSTSASSENSANESDFMNFISSYNTETITANANSSINSAFLTVVSKANFSQEGEEKQEDKIKEEIKDQKKLDIMATEEARVEQKEEEGKTTEEAKREVKEEKGETKEIEKQEKEARKNSILLTKEEKQELEEETK